MATRAAAGRRSRVSKDEARKLEKSVRSFGTLLILSAVVSVLFGLVMIWSMAAYGFGAFWLARAITSFLGAAALFWCVRLLDQKRRLARNVFVAIILIGWIVTFVLRFASQQPLFRRLDLAALIVPLAILVGMNQMIRSRILA